MRKLNLAQFDGKRVKVYYADGCWDIGRASLQENGTLLLSNRAPDYLCVTPNRRALITSTRAEYRFERIVLDPIQDGGY